MTRREWSPAVQHSAEEVNRFAQLGLGTIAYLRALDADDVKALCGREIAPHEIAFALVDADGSPILLRGSVGACMIAAEERDLHIVPIN
jgi:hypothetical protein